MIGREYNTATGFPLCFPGVIFGSDYTTEIASLSRRGCGARARTSVTLPVLSILNCTIIRCLPSKPRSLARSVLNFLLMKEDTLSDIHFFLASLFLSFSHPG